MPHPVPVTPEQHGNKRWRRYASYGFAARHALAALVGAELPKAALALPIGFMAQGEDFVPIAILGLLPGQNLFVAPNGRWLGTYVPAAFRGYPFSFARIEDGREILCVDEESGLVTDDPDGEAFFDAGNNLSPALARVMDFLARTSGNRKQTHEICALLKRHGLIQPWPITLKNGEAEQQVTGLYRIDEAALNALPDAAFLEVRAGGALPLIYCQLLSMMQLPLLGRLAELHQQAATQGNANGIDPNLLNQEAEVTFNFD